MHQGFEMGFALRCQIEFFQPVFDQRLRRKLSGAVDRGRDAEGSLATKGDSDAEGSCVTKRA